MSYPKQLMEPGSRAVTIVVGIVLLVLLVCVLIPQSVWVNLSIKLFP